MTIQWGMTNVMVETDAQPLVQAINNSKSFNLASNSVLFREIKALAMLHFMLGNVAKIQNFLRITKINLWSTLATRGRGVDLHTLVDRDAEALQERG